MGEMADYYLECAFDEDTEGYSPHPYPSVSCRVCGTKRLQWGQHKSGKWWLKDSKGNWHTCPEKLDQLIK